MGLYSEQVLPRLVNRLLDNEDTRGWRRRCVAGLRGVVVEPGFGSGLNVEVYPDEVTKVFAVDPAEVGRKLAADRVRSTDVQIEFVGLDGASLPINDRSCDAALLTFTLCTIPDADQALAELRRVLVPGGRLHFLEHGHAPDSGVQTWQRRIEPVQKVVGGGCHLTRNITDLIVSAGFELDWVEESYARGPKPLAFYYLGQAVSP